MLKDYQKTVDRIIEALRVGEIVLDEAEQLNAKLFEHVNDINERLKECDDLLEEGLLTEAIQRCQASPELLKSVSILDFPELGAWEKSMDPLGVKPPPRIEVDVASDLNDAYMNVQPLEQLLKVHRIYALSHWPLRDRIRVMRLLARRDKGNTIWKKDLSHFEKQRIRDIREELSPARAARDLKTLTNLEEELTSNDWLVKPPPALFQRVSETHGAVRVEVAYEDLQELVPQLTQAAASGDIEAARNLRSRWEAKAEICRLSNADTLDELVEQVAPTLDWINQQDEEDAADEKYQAANNALEFALNRSADRGRLEKCYYELLKYERGVEPHLEKRFNNRLKALDNEENRKKRLRVVLGLAMLLMIGLFVGYFVWHHIQGVEIAKHEKNIQSLHSEIERNFENGELDAGRERLEKAKAYLVTLDVRYPAFRDKPEIKKCVNGLDALEQQYEDLFQQDAGRTEAIQKYLNRVKKKIDAAQMAGDNVLERWQAASEGLAIVNEAESFESRGKPIFSELQERSVLNGLALELRDLRNSAQQGLDRQFHAKAEVLNKLISQLVVNDIQSINIFEDFEKRIAEIKAEATDRVSPGLIKLLDPLETTLKRKQAEYIALEGQESQFRRITQQTNNIDKYQTALNLFVSEFRSAFNAKEVEKVLQEESAHWQAFAEAETLANQLVADDVGKLSPTQARHIMDKLSSHLNRYPGLPRSEEFTHWIPTLQAIAMRSNANGQSIMEDLDNTLKKKMFQKLYMVKTTTGECYYGDKKPKTETKGQKTWLRFFHFTDRELRGTAAKRFDVEEVAGANAKKGYPAPQLELASALQADLRQGQLNDKGKFEGAINRMLMNVLNDQQTEPVLRFYLLEKLLEIGCQGSYFLQQAYGKILKDVKNSPIETSVDWIVPSPEQKRASDAAQQELDRLRGPLKDAYQKAGKLYREFRRQDNKTAPALCGWLGRDDTGVVQCLLRRPLGSGDNVALLVLHPSSGNVQMVKIGDATDSGVVLNRDAEGLRFGRPVYFSHK